MFFIVVCYISELELVINKYNEVSRISSLTRTNLWSTTNKEMT
uniref:Uncharacterized protein n=1 Tax=Anguilla anguilla TaxID=7936 RepID=A0A0E9S9I8_ANGAN